MDEPSDITWNESLENVIAKEGERCSGYAWLHSESEKHYSQRSNLIAIPVIVLSTLAGSANMALGGVGDAKITSISVGAISILTGILSTIGSYFAWAKRAETHRICAIQYQKLSRYLTIEMSLPAKERMKASDLLKTTREQIERLLEISPIIPNEVILKYKERFKDYTDIAHPENTNGLMKIEVNRSVSLSTPKIGIVIK